MATIKVNEEAVKKIAERVYDNGSTVINRNDLEEMFPELKESEDERIREKVIATIHLYYGEPLEDEAKEMIAWLEAQGEEIIPLKEIVLNVWQLGNYWRELTKGACNTEHGRQLDYIVKHWKEGEHYIKSFEKQGEHERIPKHKIGDTVYYNSFGEVKSMIVANIVTDSTDNPMYEDKDGNSVFEKDLVEQKHAENEELTEFDKAVGVSIGTWNPKTPEQIQSVKAVSKKLLKLAKKQINNEQKHAEWSEEDDQYLLVCKNALTKYQVSDKWDAHIISHWLENKLKSLKDRVQPQSQWKPNEEQIRWLYCAMDDAEKGSRMKQVLYELLEQLKKLND